MAQSLAAAGYSGTPLAKKLGFAPGMIVLLLEAPEAYAEWVAPMPPGVTFVSTPAAGVAMAHLFVTERDRLQAHLRQLRNALAAEAAVWVSWPKKASKVPTTVTEDTVRELALPMGLVDVKVCAVTDVWSGLKLVVRKELRGRGG